jgi:hypothetical protein
MKPVNIKVVKEPFLTKCKSIKKDTDDESCWYVK